MIEREALIALTRAEWSDLEECHDEALRIQDFLALVYQLKPFMLTDASLAETIEEADKERGVDWTMPVDLEAFRRYCKFHGDAA